MPARFLRFRRLVLATWALAALSACGGAAAQRVEPEEKAPDFAGLRYPAPEPPAAPGRLPPPPTPGQVYVPPPPPGTVVPAPEDAEALRNAAVRDQETERLARGYFVLVEALYRLGSGRSAGDEDGYDPRPLSRLHAELRDELSDLTRRAAALQGRYLQIATEQAIDLLGDPDAAGRPGRVRFYFRMTSCIRRDVEERAADGERFLQAAGAGKDDGVPTDRAGMAKRRAADLQRLGNTLECSRLVARSLQQQ